MTPKARAMRDLLDAAGRLGFEVWDHPKGGLVVGTAEFVERVGVDKPSDLPIAKRPRLEGPESPIDEIAPEATALESPTEAVQEDAILAPDSEHPEAPASKVAGRILGAVNGKPVGMLSQVPGEGD